MRRFYSQTPPKVIASKPAGQWQTFDIFFRARGSMPAARSSRRPVPPVPERHSDSPG